ncbi:hypothetical protein [Zhongshania marina]|uniref:Transglutaminase-like domain-containing protein n=1 Tax=Zhongshania marina TaxID=2304603 RepID=A0A2S4HGD7_9GAMM|nr:hypothetical protein [Marortus luteolus]POP53054.1 hypothetical protein C0068_08155 [Marortus luteolus]
MKITDAVIAVAKKFEYRADPDQWIDPWFVMREKNGKLHGDCDDFTISCLYRYLGFWKFIWQVCITHKAQIHRFKTVNGEFHVGGCVNGLWFDNYTRRALPKRQFYEETGHTYLKRYYVWHFGVKLVAGLFVR